MTETSTAFSKTDKDARMDINSLDAQREDAKSAGAFDDLLAEFRDMSDSERLKGTLFEELIRSYLLNDSQMSRQFARVYLWSDWPGREGKPDTGIDLVAIESQDMPADEVVTAHTPAVAIQCKFYAPGTRISKEHLDSFLSDSGKEPFKRRIYVETTGTSWSKNAEEAINEQTKPVTRIGLSDLRNSDIDWATYSLANPQDAPERKPRKSLRDHQVNAITDVKEGFKHHDRGILVMACGTGKTFTSLKIAEETVDDCGGSARVMFMVPSLALMSQTLHEWNAECQVPFTAWSVCSDAKVNRTKAKTSDAVDITSVDLKTPPTTDPDKLAASLNRFRNADGLQVVFATYQSIDIVHQAQELAGDDWRDFDLIICDEAHRTTGATLVGEDESAFVRVHDNDYVRADKRLYMTATPKIFDPRVKNAAKEKDAVLASMDDESVFGSLFHKLSFGTAVSQGLLTDYKVVVLGIPEDQITPLYQNPDEYGELPIPEMAKLVGCWNALAKRKNGLSDTQYGSDDSPMRRAVAFAKDIKTSKQVASEFPDLVEGLRNLGNDDPSDDLAVECQHVDGTMNAVQRGQALDWLKEDVDADYPTCRILTNARCLSEGVDVPTLDAVLFLNPRRSQVDVIQAVGRVMRKAEGKEFGYIILPVAVPVGVSPEQALNDNSRFQVVWQVVQAIRAHDERMDNTINAMEFNVADPSNIIVDMVDLKSPKKKDLFDGSAPGDDSTDGGSPTGDEEPVQRAYQPAFNFPVEEWKDAVYSKIVKKVGNRLYWDDWSKEIGDIAARYINLIEHLLDDKTNQDYFATFVKALQDTLNPAVDADQAVEMLAQHLITKPLFDAMFPDQEFTAENPVSRAMQGILDRLATNSVFENEREPLAKFYETMTEKIRAIDNLAGKQEIMRTLYDKFFSKAFPSMQDRLGIVFTPVPVVDYILKSADVALRRHLGKSLGESGVAIIEPFLGTGTFVSRLLQTGLISASQLEHKYRHEIFANEIVLLSYYIASINTEEVYRQVRLEQGFDDGYVEFPGISLTDTFQLDKGQDEITGLGGFAENMRRMQRQKDAEIRVVVMNPPYSAGQASANDNNQNLKYTKLDQRIAETYAARSTGTNKNSLYDSYFRSLRWATDRIGDEGVIAFVSNSSFIEGNTADGVRKTWADEFSDIYVYNLRGGVRGKMGEAAAREGGNVFDIMTGVAVTILVKEKGSIFRPARIHYAEVDDYLARQEKLDVLDAEGSIQETEFERITPNAHGDWLNQRDERYLGFQQIGDKKNKGKPGTEGVFSQFSRGLETSRDTWCYNYSFSAVANNMSQMIYNYNAQLQAGKTSKTANMSESYVSWTRKLKKSLDKRKIINFDNRKIWKGVYRPFCQQAVYFDSDVNEYTNQLPQIFPTSNQPNIGFTLEADGRRETSLFMMSDIPDLHYMGTTQFFPLYTWEKPSEDGLQGSLLDVSESESQREQFSVAFDFSRSISSQVPEIVGGYRRRDNITDATLVAYRDHYSDSQIAKEDIFFYVYSLLHHNGYRERYEADLKKMLPRIPKVSDFHAYAAVGRELADLHVNYESVEAYPQVHAEWTMLTPSDDWSKYRVTKLAWGKAGGRGKDMTRLVYNEYLTFTDIPPEANDYKIGGRSPLEWMIDRYKITTDKKTGIVNDPNDYCREISDPAYIARLIPSLATVSMRTQELVAGLPDLVIED